MNLNVLFKDVITFQCIALKVSKIYGSEQIIDMKSPYLLLQ